MDTHLTIPLFISHEREGSYFTLPFRIPPGIESLALRYTYDRRPETGQPLENGRFTSRVETSIIDLGLLAPDGSQVGASGSDKTAISVSATRATPGYRPTALVPGDWQILVGAYKVAPGGVQVTYEIELTPKQPRWLKGDLHLHTLASDGVLSTEELARHARRNGLDFLAVTDHNQMVARAALPDVPGLTLIPGMEWTHYRGHANFLGIDCPYDGSFMANSEAEALERFQSARQRGATIVLNHPFDEQCPFTFDLQAFPVDCLEVWNGPMRPANLQALASWQARLAAGGRLPVCGGSDYHRDQLFLFPGGPTTCVFSDSDSVADILSALRAGHAFITYAPEGPMLEMRAGDCRLGDSLTWTKKTRLEIHLDGLAAGDVVQVVGPGGPRTLLTAPAPGRLEVDVQPESPGFMRVEVLRVFVPGLPPLPALVSNPIYLEG